MNKNLHIDELDKKILSLLMKDARMPFLEVARECGVSGAAIHQRVQKLISDGIISGSEILVDPHKIGYSTCAYIGIFLEKASMFSLVAEELVNIPEIVECHYTTGNYSIFIKVFAKDNNHLKQILSDKLQSIKGISRTETFISLEESFRRNLPVK
jgi:Lrp/AsnC family transcriptional regulator, regulator for asnA, asnC and gidA